MIPHADVPGAAEADGPGATGATGATGTSEADARASISRRGRLGVGIVQIGPDLRAHLGVPRDRGVLVDGVQPNSPAARAGVQTGDVILDVDGTPARSLPDVVSALGRKGKGDVASLSVMRGATHLTLLPRLDTAPERWPTFGDAPRFDLRFDSRELQRSLDDANRKLEALEKRVEKLERS